MTTNIPQETKPLYIINPYNKLEVMIFVGGEEDEGYQFLYSFTSSEEVQAFIDEQEAIMNVAEKEAEEYAIETLINTADFALTFISSITSLTSSNEKHLMSKVLSFTTLGLSDHISTIATKFLEFAGTFFSITAPTYNMLKERIDEKNEAGAPLTADQIMVYRVGYMAINKLSAELMGKLMKLGIDNCKSLSKAKSAAGTGLILAAQSIAGVLTDRLKDALNEYMELNWSEVYSENSDVEARYDHIKNFVKITKENFLKGETAEEIFKSSSKDLTKKLRTNYDLTNRYMGYRKFYISSEHHEVILQISIDAPGIIGGAKALIYDTPDIMTLQPVSREVREKTEFSKIDHVIGSKSNIKEYLLANSNEDNVKLNYYIFYNEEKFEKYKNDLKKENMTFEKPENPFYTETPILSYSAEDLSLKLDLNINQINQTTNDTLVEYVNVIKEELSVLYESANSILIHPSTDTGIIERKYWVEKVSLDELMELKGMKNLAISNDVISESESLFENIGYDSAYIQEHLNKFKGRIASDGSFVILYEQEGEVYVKETLNDILFPVIGNDNSNILFGKHSSDTLEGNGGSDYIFGWGQDANEQTGDVNTWSETHGNADAGDTIYGGTGEDHIFGGKGNDTLYGGDGTTADNAEDIFYFKDGDGQDTIKDIDNKDRIRINNIELGTTYYLVEESKNSTPNIEYYKDINGSQYTYNTTTKQLDIIYGKSTPQDFITIENFDSGKGGIVLEKDIFSYKYGGWENDIKSFLLPVNPVIISTSATTPIAGDIIYFLLNEVSIDKFDTLQNKLTDSQIEYFENMYFEDIDKYKNDGYGNAKIIIQKAFFDKYCDEDITLPPSSVVLGTKSDEVINGSVKDDLVIAFNVNNEISAGAGNDVILGGDDKDTIFAGENNDILIGGKGNDELYGGTGTTTDNAKDTFYFKDGDGQDTIHDAEIVDRISINDTIIEGDIYYLKALSESMPGEYKYYIDAERNSYTYEASTKQLTIIYSNSVPEDTILIENFTDGVCGIKLNDNVFNYYCGDWEKTASDLAAKLLIDENAYYTFADLADSILTEGDVISIPVSFVSESKIDLLSETFTENQQNYFEDTYHDNPSLFDGDLSDAKIIIQKASFDKYYNESVFIKPSEVVLGTKYDETIVASSQNDFVIGFDGVNEVYTGDGNDVILGGKDQDTISAGEESDVLIGGKGNDVLIGEGGHDIYRFNDGDGQDTIKDTDGQISINSRIIGKNLIYDKINSNSIKTVYNDENGYTYMYDIDSGDLIIDYDHSLLNFDGRDQITIENFKDGNLGIELKIDSDGDRLFDVYELNEDTDGDGLLNYLDSDDDGDGDYTMDENADPNGDGNPDDAGISEDGRIEYLDGNDTLSGSGNLYGGEGKDTFVNTEGATAYGGSDFDTYKMKTGTIIDSDGLGKIEGARGKFVQLEKDEKVYYNENKIKYSAGTITGNGFNLNVSLNEKTSNLGITLISYEKAQEMLADNSFKDLMDRLYSLFKSAETKRSPLVLDLNGDGVKTSTADNGVYFDHDNNGLAEKTAWINEEDGLLVYDRNGDGIINNGTELFGDNTLLSSGKKASNGFEALKDLDSNNDGVIDSQDTEFNQLKVWKDTNHNGINEGNELISLSEAGVKSISTSYSNSSLIDENGNAHKQISTFNKSDGSVNEIHDVWFDSNKFDTISTSPLDETEEIKGLPDIKGFGNVHSLRQAMLRDSSGELQALVMQFENETNEYTKKNIVTDIVYHWTGVQDIDPNSREASRIYGNVIGDARKLEALEEFFGEDYMGIWCWGEKDPNPHGQAAPYLLQTFDELTKYVYNRLLSQTEFKELYKNVRFTMVDDEIKMDLSNVAKEITNLINTNEIEGNKKLDQFMDNFYKLGLNSFVQQNSLKESDKLLFEYFSVNSILGTDADNLLIGTNESEEIFGFDGDDIIDGNNGNDTIIAGLGDDLVQGGNGNNTYVYNLGDGTDTIRVARDAQDTLIFGEGIVKENISIAREGTNLVVYLSNSNDKVIIGNWYEGYKLSKIIFESGEEFTREELNEIGLTRIGTFENDIISGVDYEDDKLYGLEGDDILQGNSGNDLLEGGSGNDFLEGGSGNDTYIFNIGDGINTIYDAKYIKGSHDERNNIYRHSGSDIIRLGENIKEEDIIFKYETPNLTIGIKDNGKTFDELTDKIIIENFNTISMRIEYLEFFNGTKIDLEKIVLENINSNNNDEIIFESEKIIQGLDGDDHIITGDEDNIIKGGRGNDVIEGNYGYNTYIYILGDGNDIIKLSSIWRDVLSFGSGILKEDVNFTRNEDNLILSISTNNSTITFENWYRGYKLKEIVFADGGRIQKRELDEIGLLLEGTSSDDTLVGSSDDDIILGYAGDDTIKGEYGDDTFIGGLGNDTIIDVSGANKILFNRGDGQDIIRTNSLSFIQLGAGISANDIELKLINDDLIIALIEESKDFNSYSDKLIISDFINFYYQIERIEFYDGKNLTIEDIYQILNEKQNIIFDSINYNIQGTKNGDIIVTKTSENIINSGLGSDEITTYWGNNTYIFNRGDGQDYIDDHGGSNDIIKFGQGIRVSDIIAIVDNNKHKLILAIKEEEKNFEELSDKIEVNLSSIEKIIFDDGQELTYSDLANLYQTENDDYFSFSNISTINTLEGNDTILVGGNTEYTINSGSGDDSIRSGQKNDYIDAGSGNDVLESSYGNDILVGGTENDFLYGGYGNDVYIFNKDDGKDFIYDYGGDNDVIQFGENISPNDIIARTEGKQLVLGIKEEGVDFENLSQKITIQNESHDKIEVFTFNDGQELEYDDIVNLQLSDSNDFFDIITNNPIYSLSGNDTIILHKNNSIVYAGTGEDTIYSKNYSSNTIHGEKGNDIIYADGSIIEGGEGNDIIYGGVKSNVYIYNRGDGIDEINNTSFNEIIFGEGITKDEIYVLEDENAFTILLKEKNIPLLETKSRMIFNKNNGRNLSFNYKLNSGLEFRPQVFSSPSDIYYFFENEWDDILLEANALDNYIQTGFGDDIIKGGDGNDIIAASRGNNEIYGEAGDDTLKASSNSIFVGGEGNDYLYGSSFEDIYIFNRGDGQDVIINPVSNSKFDTIKFGIGISPDDIWIKETEIDILTFAIKEDGKSFERLLDKISCKKSWVDYTVEYLEFESGERIHRSDFFKFYPRYSSGKIIESAEEGQEVNTGAGDDSIQLHGINYSGVENAIINSGKGNDYIVSVSASTTHIYNRGDGKNIIEEDDSGTNILKFGENISKNDIIVDFHNRDIIVYLKEENKHIQELSDFIVFRETSKYYETNTEFISFEFVNDEILSLKKLLELPHVLGKNTDLALDASKAGRIIGTSHDDFLIGSTSNDILEGDAGNDILKGDAGNDILIGNWGNDTYLFNKGDGRDEIKNAWDSDTLKFGQGITPDDLIINLFEEKKLLIGIKNSSLTLEDITDKVLINLSSNPESFTVEFASGTRLGISELLKLENNSSLLWGETLFITPTDSDDLILINNDIEQINGGNGNDNISGENYYNNLTIEGGKGNDILDVYGKTNTFIYSSGDGKDVIKWLHDGSKIIFTGNITKDNLIVKTQRNLSSANDYSIIIGLKEPGKSFDDLSDKIIINYLGKASLEFSNGDSLSYEDILSLLCTNDNDHIYLHEPVNLNLEDGNDKLTISSYWNPREISTINGGNGDDVILVYQPGILNGGSGDDLLKASSSDDVLNGNDDNDTLVAYKGNDVLYGGKGNDILYGGEDNDKYIFNLGDGIDIIHDTSISYFKSNNDMGNDLLSFGEGITKENIVVKISNENLIIGIVEENIHFDNLKDKVTILNQMNDKRRIERFEFSDGTVLDYREFELLSGNTGDNIIITGDNNDILEGGFGSDILEGGFGNDVYLYNRGDGQDIISDLASNIVHSRYDNPGIDTIKFGKSINIKDLVMQINGDDLIIGLEEEFKVFEEFSDKITIKGFMQSKSKIEFFEFYDGTKLDTNNLIIISDGNSTVTGDENDNLIFSNEDNNTIISGLGNDLIKGGHGENTLVGDSGDDTLIGGNGSNIYIYNIGDGNDNISIATGAIDSLSLGEGLTSDDLTFYRQESNLIINMPNVNDSITINNWYDGNKLNAIQFHDGTSLSTSEIDSIGLNVKGTDNDDILTAYDTNDTLEGLAGNDLLIGGTGNDTMIGGLGDDILEGGIGTNTYMYNTGEGSDTIRVSAEAKDILTLGAGITKEDLTISRQGSDLIIDMSTAGDSIKVEGWYAGNKLSSIEFADGSTLTTADLDIVGAKITGTSNDDILTGFTTTDILEGLEGNDTLQGLGGDDTLIGGTGDDILEGGIGSNTYVYNVGEGSDTIRVSEGALDTLTLGVSITKEDLSIYRQGSNLVIDMVTEGDFITVEDWFNGNKLNSIQFNNGTTLTTSDLDDLGTHIRGTNDADILTGFETADTLEALEGNDTLQGLAGNDTLISGTGDDILEGGSGMNTYVYKVGDGSDTIRVSAGATDTLTLGAGIAKSNLTVYRQDSGLVIDMPTEGDFITIEGWYLGNKLDLVQFNDGTTLTTSELDNLGTHIRGTSSDDIIIAYDSDDTIEALGGNDTLQGLAGNDTLIGGTGNDILEGGFGSNTYVYNVGDGSDTIKVTAGATDTLTLGAGIVESDLNVYRQGSNLVINMPTEGDSITVEDWFNGNKLNLVQFNDGTTLTTSDLDGLGTHIKGTSSDDIITAYDSNDTLEALGGNDTLQALAGNDTIIGGTGNDILEGGFGSNTYVYNVGDGSDTIKVTAGATDTLTLGAGIVEADLSVYRQGTNLLIDMPTEGDSITVEDWFNGNKLNLVQFSDGTTLTTSNLDGLGTHIKGTSSDDILTAYDSYDTIEALGGNDTLQALAGNDTLIGGTGNDILEGGDGSNTYVYNVGDGSDTIKVAAGAIDSLALGTGITKDELTVYRQGTNLIIDMPTEGDFITVQDWFNGNKLNLVQFNDGTTLTTSDLDGLGAYIKGTSSDDILTGHGSDDTLEGLEGNDTLIGLSGNDTLIGGTGNDILEGGSGSNTYVYNVGDGTDTIRVSAGATDTLTLGAEITKEDLTIYREGSNLVIDMPTAGDFITVEDWFSGNKLYLVQFSDGTSLTTSDLDDLGTHIRGTSSEDIIAGYDSDDTLEALGGNDTLQGLAGNDTLIGGTGDDILEGGSGSNTYVYNVGDGADTIKVSAGATDTLTLGAGIAQSDLSVYRQGADLVIDMPAEGDSITVQDWFSGNKLNLVQFADGSLLTTTDLDTVGAQVKGTSNEDILTGYTSDDTLEALEGNDTLQGLSGNDTLIGGTGDDILEGGSGSNTYVYNVGDGADTIKVSAGATDTLTLGAGIAQSDLSVYRQGADLVIDMPAEGDSITVQDWFSGNKLNLVQFTDGSTLTTSELDNLGTHIRGTSSDEIITAYDSHDTIEALGGSDTLQGLSGNDTLIGGTGDDILEGGSGSNTYVYNVGDGTDTIRVAAGATDMLTLGAGITESDLSVYRQGTNLLIDMPTEGDSITVEDWFNGNKLNLVQFSDGTTLTTSNLDGLGTHIKGTSSDDILTAYDSDDTIEALEGNDTLQGLAGNDTLIGGTGDDILEGGSGSNTYVYNVGDGSDTIRVAEGAVDTLILGSGITKENLSVYRQGSNLVIDMPTEADSITIEDWFSGNKLNLLQLNDGTTLTTSELDSFGTHIKGSSSDETLTGYNSDDTLEALGGNDTIKGLVGDDILIGGTGNDTIEGGSGSNTYIYNIGDGTDTVTVSTGSTDALSLGSGLTKENISLSIDGVDLIIESDQANDKIIIKDQFKFEQNTVNEEIVIEAEDYNKYKDKDTANKGGKYRNDGVDIQNCSAGGYNVGWIKRGEWLEYTVESENGGEYDLGITATSKSSRKKYFISVNGKNVTGTKRIVRTGGLQKWETSSVGKITLQKGTNKIKFFARSSGFNLDSFTLTREEVVNNVKPNNDSSISKINFNDGSSWSQEEIYTQALETSNLIKGNNSSENIIGTDLDDYIDSLSGKDIITAGLGNDIINGGLGNDTYIFNSGDGQDTIYDDAGNDKLVTNLNPLDIIFNKTDDTLEMLLNNSEDKITMNNWDLNGTIEEISVNDNQYISSDKVDELIQAMSIFSAQNEGISWETALEEKKGDVDLLISSYYQQK